MDENYAKFEVSCKVALFQPGFDKVLLIQYKINNTWSIPGGHLENGETLEVAAIRELGEELGQNFAKNIKLEHGEFLFSELNDKIVLIFYGIIDEDLIRETILEKDILLAEWKNVSALENGEIEIVDYGEKVVKLAKRLRRENGI